MKEKKNNNNNIGLQPIWDQVPSKLIEEKGKKK